jgi:hypothetical protein
MRQVHADQRWARVNSIVGSTTAATCGAYGGFVLGFHGSSFMFGIAAAGGGAKTVWEPMVFTIGSGLLGAAAGAIGGGLTYPLFYGGSNLVAAAFPSFKILENRLLDAQIPRRLALKTFGIVSAVLLVFDLCYLQQIGLIFSIPAYALIWKGSIRKQE